MIAFFTVNDVSDREPIIKDDQIGYTRAKGRPGFLPAGPWLVPGQYLLPTTKEGGSEPLALELAVRRRGSTAWQPKRYASSVDMILGPRAILAELQTRVAEKGSNCAPGKICSMPDANGQERFMVRDDELPAGSIVLTGTPGGTVIKEPNVLQKLWLFVRGGFSRARARDEFLADQLKNRVSLGYLQPGDEVNQAITGLGRQIWTVDEATDKLPAGKCAPIRS